MIPTKQLTDLGFTEIAKNLFMKDLGNGTRLFRDYRNNKTSYAYKNQTRIPTELFKEFEAIEKIEQHINKQILCAY